MAVGKTTLGNIVAKKLGLEFIDTDASIEKNNSMTINEIFEKKGEDFFRIKEEIEVLKSMKKNNHVIALGGGAFMNKKIRESILKSAVSVWLDTNVDILSSRIKWNNKRPLLKTDNRIKKLNELYNERKFIYKLADYRIKCDNLNKENIIKKIISLYEKN